MAAVKTRKRYDADFKHQLCRRAVKDAVSVASLAQEAGIRENMLHRWIGQYRRRENWAKSIPGAAQTRERLLRENQKLRKEIEEIKKRIFSASKHSK